MTDRPTEEEEHGPPGMAPPPDRTPTLKRTKRSGNHFIHSGYRMLRRGFTQLCRTCSEPDCKHREEGADAFCRPMAAAREKLIRQIEALPHIDPTIDLPTIIAYVNARLACSLIERHVGREGLFIHDEDGGLGIQPAVRAGYVAMANLARRLAADLGLTPAARKALAATGEGGAAAQLAAAFRGLQDRPGPTVDAEFRAEEATSAGEREAEVGEG